jgi:hypothetical protein
MGVLLAPSAQIKAKAFRALRESLFFERQRKVTKRKPPCGAPDDETVGSASAAGIFGRHIHVPSKNGAHRVRRPFGVCPLRLPHLTGLLSNSNAEARQLT